MNNEIKRTIILENYQHPKNRGLIDDKSYDKIVTNSKSCIDQIDLQIKLENNKVVDVRFDGEACAICTSSTSILINLILGKTKEEALNIIDNSIILEEAIVYQDISKEPNRINCATLTWKGIKNYLDKK